MAGEKLHCSRPLIQEWLDAYGHLNEAYYLVAFTDAAWQFGEDLDIGAAYLKRTGCAFYTVESHLRYLKEVRMPAQLEIDAILLDVDTKRYRIGMFLTVDNVERATLESVAVHLDTRMGKTAPIPDEIVSRLTALRSDVLPDWAGRGITFVRK